jgi:hypothetical protein
VSRRPRALVLVSLVVVIPALLGVTSNVVTGLLSDSWRIAPWVVWTVFAVLVLASIGLALWQASLDSGGPPAVERPAGVARPERPVPAQLPPDVPEFTGRADEVARLREQLGSTDGPGGGGGRAVAISAIAGKPGIGKSALAIHLAHQVAAAFPDGQLYVNLRGAERRGLDPAVVLGQFLQALRLPDEDIPTELDEQVARYRTLLAGRRMLVVLDNAADAAQVRPLLPGSPPCAVLITSRNPLTALEGASPLALEFLDRPAAVELLGKLTGRARVAAEPQAAEAIAGYCGDLPLALRIAGARLAARPAWPLAALAERLADERRRLTELRAGDPGAGTRLVPGDGPPGHLVPAAGAPRGARGGIAIRQPRGGARLAGGGTAQPGRRHPPGVPARLAPSHLAAGRGPVGLLQAPDVLGRLAGDGRAGAAGRPPDR